MLVQLGSITHSGHPVIDQTSITFDSVDHATGHWGGSFRVGEESLPDLQVGCRLEMADGRSGDIVLFRRDAGSDRTAVIYFHGVGRLQ